jgi:hypothetical protein
MRRQALRPTSSLRAAALIIWSAVISALGKRGSITNVPYLCCNPCASKLCDRPHHLERGHQRIWEKEAASPMCLIFSEPMRRQALRPSSSFGARSSAHWEKEAASPMCLIFVVIHAPLSFMTVVITWSAIVRALHKEKKTAHWEKRQRHQRALSLLQFMRRQALRPVSLLGARFISALDKKEARSPTCLFCV